MVTFGKNRWLMSVCASYVSWLFVAYDDNNCAPVTWDRLTDTIIASWIWHLLTVERWCLVWSVINFKWVPHYQQQLNNRETVPDRKWEWKYGIDSTSISNWQPASILGITCISGAWSKTDRILASSWGWYIYKVVAVLMLVDKKADDAMPVPKYATHHHGR